MNLFTKLSPKRRKVSTQEGFSRVYAHLRAEGKEQLKHLVLDLNLHHFEAMDMMLTQHQDLFLGSIVGVLDRGHCFD